MVIKEILDRYSVRSYSSDEIPENDLNEILESARLAPSACNIQPWKFVVVKDQKIKDELSIAMQKSEICCPSFDCNSRMPERSRSI